MNSAVRPNEGVGAIQGAGWIRTQAMTARSVPSSSLVTTVVPELFAFLAGIRPSAATAARSDGSPTGSFTTRHGACRMLLSAFRASRAPDRGDAGDDTHRHTDVRWPNDRTS